MNLLKSATLIVDDPEASAARYVEWFQYQIAERGAVDPDLAASWGAPKCSGQSYVICKPDSGANVFIRFIQGETPADYQPLRTFGWAAIELCVRDVEAVHARMVQSPFEVIGPPRLLDSMPQIYPMQVRGPDKEILFLTEIRDDMPGVILPRAKTMVDQLFILVLACADLSLSVRWFCKILDLKIGIDAHIIYTMLSRAFELPRDHKHHIMTTLHQKDSFLEFDQYPKAAALRHCAPGCLPPGVALATFILPDLSSAEGDWLSPPRPRHGVLYQGKRCGVMRGPDGVLIEIIEAS